MNRKAPSETRILLLACLTGSATMFGAAIVALFFGWLFGWVDITAPVR